MDNTISKDLMQSYTIDEITPAKSEVFTSMGIEESVPVPEDVRFLYEETMKIFNDLVKPIGLIKQIDKDSFEELLKGEGQNESKFPLQDIVAKASHLALFVFTLGEQLSHEIQQLLRNKDYPTGYMLDIIASRSAELATVIQEKRFIENINFASNQKALLYSPGYCGWHITAQQKIFAYLKPEEINVKLNESSLMSPVKSVTGIMIAGEREIHNFKNNFSFCRSCKTFSCRERMKT